MTKQNKKTTGWLFARHNAIVIALLALFVFTMSFFLPAIDFGLGQLTGAQCASISFESMLGKSSLVDNFSAIASQVGDPSVRDIEGSFILAWVKFSWLANAGFLIALTMLFLSRPLLFPAFVVSSVSFIWGASALIDFDQIGDSWHNFEAFSIGYHAWIVSCLLLIIACMLHPESAKDDGAE